jgi:hypothetical protein
MTQIEISINPSDKPRLADAFRILKLDENNNKFTLGNESRFRLTGKLQRELLQDKTLETKLALVRGKQRKVEFSKQMKSFI